MRYGNACVWPLIAGCAVMLAGCAVDPSRCDPTAGDTDLFTKINCTYSGTYDGRVADKERTLAYQQALNAQFKEAFDAIEQEQAQSTKALRKKQADASGLKRKVGNLLAQLRQKMATRADMQQRISAVEARLADLPSSPNMVGAKQQELAQLRTQLGNLQRDLEL